MSKTRAQKSGAWLARVPALIVIAAALSSCASDRKLSVEEDARIYEKCHENGCAFVPIPIWNGIRQILKDLIEREENSKPQEQST